MNGKCMGKSKIALEMKTFVSEGEEGEVKYKFAPVLQRIPFSKIMAFVTGRVICS